VLVVQAGNQFAVVAGRKTFGGNLFGADTTRRGHADRVSPATDGSIRDTVAVTCEMPVRAVHAAASAAGPDQARARERLSGT
jgi:hypothetical protein